MRCQHCRTPLSRSAGPQGSRRFRCPQCGCEVKQQDQKASEFGGLDPEALEGLETLRQRILVVEDSAMVREMVRDLLEEAGYVVDTTCDGESALRAVSRASYDLLVLDVYLPLYNGFEVIQSLRQYPDTRDLPIVAISGSCNTTGELRALRLSGADTFVDKAQLKSSLVERVRSALNRELAGASAD